MRIALLVLFLMVISSHHVKADWELFPLNQKSYYQFTSLYYGDERINMINFDTLIQRSGYQVSFQNRKNESSQLSACYNSLADEINSTQWHSWMDIEFDSIFFSGDTVFCNPGTIFFPMASPGFSWRTAQGSLANFMDIEITCISISLQNFQGQMDSVKEFRLETYNGINQVASPFSGYIIKLSKNHGLIKYPEFTHMKNHQFESHELIGYTDHTGNSGFYPPEYTEYFPYNAGDIINWIHETHPWSGPYEYIYYRDSVTGVFITADTLKYTFDRREFRSATGAFYNYSSFNYYPVKWFKSILESPSNWFSFNCRENCFTTKISFSSSYILENDSSISRNIVFDGHQYYDTITCSFSQIPDATMHDMFNSKLGWTESCYDAFYYNCQHLSGAYLSGVLYGDTSLVTKVESVNSEFRFQLFPNPALNSMQVRNVFPGSQLTLLTVQGVLCKNWVAIESSMILDLKNLSPGIYFLRSIDPNGIVQTKKLIKTEK